jgi:hypothetical protein
MDNGQWPKCGTARGCGTAPWRQRVSRLSKTASSSTFLLVLLFMVEIEPDRLRFVKSRFVTILRAQKIIGDGKTAFAALKGMA